MARKQQCKDSRSPRSQPRSRGTRTGQQETGGDGLQNQATTGPRHKQQETQTQRSGSVPERSETNTGRHLTTRIPVSPRPRCVSGHSTWDTLRARGLRRLSGSQSPGEAGPQLWSKAVSNSWALMRLSGQRKQHVPVLHSLPDHPSFLQLHLAALNYTNSREATPGFTQGAQP